jgi:lipoprotein-anchoring transpeptidase ErfK/SrfK
MQLYWTKYSLHVDLSRRSLEVRYGGRGMSRYPVTVGGSGTETPLGRYAVTDALIFESSPFYGCCALALSGHQTKLPPGWIGGNRLAIHGTPGPVGLADSHGCVRATDATMRKLFSQIPLGAPVFVSS